MENKKHEKISTDQKLLMGYFLLAVLEGILGAIYLMAIPSDPKNQWLLGYSLSRLVLLAVFVVLIFVSCWLVLYVWRNTIWGEQVLESIFTSRKLKFWLLGLSGVGLLLAVTILITPLYRFRSWQSYVERLYPFVWYFAFLGLQTLFGLFYREKSVYHERFKRILQRNKSNIIFSIFIFIGMMVVWAIIASTGVGVHGDGGLWREAGAPLLLGQILLALSVAVIGCVLISYVAQSRMASESKYWNWLRRREDIIISVLIWLSTFWAWTHPLFQKSFFLPGPYPPGGKYFPFADAATWDLNAQFALIGQGFANGNAFANHIALSGFEAILHLLVGQDYSRLVTLQVALYALFPVVLYWLGRRFYSGSTGIFVALLAIFHEENAFASGNMINLSHAKTMLTEFPVGLGLAAMSLWLFLWIKEQPQRNIAYTLPIGGVLAIVIMTRFNAMVLPLALILGIVLVFKHNRMMAFKSSSLLLLSITAVFIPWMWRSWKVAGTPFFFTPPISTVFDEEFRTNLDLEIDRQFSVVSVPKGHERALVSGTGEKQMQPIERKYLEDTTRPSVVLTVLNHFFHNIVTSVLILPVTPYLHDLKHTIYVISPFWDKFGEVWTGNLTGYEKAGVFFNLILLSIGIGYSWKKWKLAGLVPLGVYFAYHASTALARTSGGRYIVPVNWVVLLYFALGIMQIVSLGSTLFELNSKPTLSHLINANVFGYKNGILYLLPFLLFTSMFTAIDQLMPKRLPALTKHEILEKIVGENLLSQTDISIRELSAFLDDPDARAFWGVSMFPRYYEARKGESTFARTAYSPEEFPRLGFQFIGPFGVGESVLPLSQPPRYFPHAEDVIVIGCEREKNAFVPLSLDAIAVIVFGDNGRAAVYVRDQETRLQCPLSVVR